MLKAVAACHTRQIIHHDVKPENFIFARETGEIGNAPLKLIDFGLSELDFEADRNGLKTYRNSPSYGTAAYMSPEIMRSEPYGKQSDVWSIGRGYSTRTRSVVTNDPSHNCFCEEDGEDTACPSERGRSHIARNAWRFWGVLCTMFGSAGLKS